MGSIGGNTGSKNFGRRMGHAVKSDGTLVTAFQTAVAAGLTVSSSANRGDSWTDRMALTSPVAIDTSPGSVQIAMFPDGSLAVAVRAADRQTIRYTKVNTSTWAQEGSWETAATVQSTQQLRGFDIDVSDASVVGLAIHFSTGTTQLSIQLRTRITSGSWNTSGGRDLYTGTATRREAPETISVAAMGIVSGVRLWVMASGHGTSSQDYGLQWGRHRVTEATGVVSGAAFDVEMTTYAGTMGTALTTPGLRQARIFRLSGDTYVLMAATKSGSTWSHFALRNTVTTTTIGTPNSISGSAPSAHQSRIEPNWGFSVDSGGYLSFRYALSALSNGVNAERIGAAFAQLPATGAATQWTGAAPVAMSGAILIGGLGSGPKRNLAQARHDFMWSFLNPMISTSPGQCYKESIPTPASGIAARVTTPSDLASDVPSRPTITAAMRLGTRFSPGVYVLVTYVSQDATFATGVIQYASPASTTARTITGTEAESSFVSMSTQLPAVHALSNGTWFLRVALQDVLGNVGPVSATTTFSVGHPPVATAVSPKGGSFNWNGGVVTFAWNFTDPSPGDTQTAFAVTLRDAWYETTVLTSGKISSSSQSWTTTVPAANRGSYLYWYVVVYDSQDTPSLPSADANFLLQNPPTTSVTAPANGSTLATGIPTVTYSVTSGSGMDVKEHGFVIERAGEIMWTHGSTENLETGGTRSVNVPSGILENYSSYSVYSYARDTYGLRGTSPIVNFAIQWVPPTTPGGVTADAGPYSSDGEGYVKVGWDDSDRDIDFVAWMVYRKADMIDALGQTVSEGVREHIATVYDISEYYEYRDYLAPSSYKITYSIVQAVNRNGQELTSAPGESTPIVASGDGYWLIEPGFDGIALGAFKLSNVTGDSFADEQEEEEFTVIGRGRVVNKGQRIGIRGTLDAQLRSGGGTTARQKKQRLEELQRETGQLLLRTPFGDVYGVSISGIQFSRVPGVGLEEFCDISIPYAEVN